LSPAAIKASAGATEHLLLAPVDDLAATLADLHGDGLRIVGADEEASLSYAEADLRGPLVLVVGSEGRGISGPVRRRLDLALRIPMRGRIASLNAAVAGSILLFAAAQQRPQTDTPTAEAAEGPEVTQTAAKAKATRKRASAKSEPKAETKPKITRTSAKKSEPKANAKPRRLTIRRVKPGALADEGLLPDDS
jgi:tRNA(Leu) C34 or U34 (ribose-2'-O)-methylase TrmL